MYAEPSGHDGRSITDDCRVAGTLARRLRNSRASLSLRWLERTSARVNMPPNEVFPSQDLLDHVPLLVEAIADYLENPTEEGPAAERVIAKAAELGQMRFRQGFSAYQILKEFEILGGILLSYLSRAADDVPLDCPPGELLVCAQRVHRALALIQQATTARYLAMLETHASEREQRLRALSDMLSGPLGQRLDDAIAAARELEAEVGPAEHAVSHDLRARLERVAEAVSQLRLLSDVSPSTRMQRNVPLNSAVSEAIRTLRHAARERTIEIRVPEPLPEMEVNAAAVELAMLVFLTTLLKHGQPSGEPRWIEVLGLASGARIGSMVQLSVRDVGSSISESAREALLHPRPEDSVSDSPPEGISLEIAREAIEAMGGRISLRTTQSPPSTEFILELPSRRQDDRDIS